MILSDYTWHALFCPPNQELATAHELWEEAGVPMIVPAAKNWREIRPGSKRTHIAMVPVFPRYLFTGFRSPPNWMALRERYSSIQGYMSFGAGPSIIKLSDMEWLRDLREELAGRKKPLPFEEAIRPGDQVKIARGTFAGHVVTVDKVVAKKIHAFKELLGGMVLVKISLGEVAPV